MVALGAHKREAEVAGDRRVGRREHELHRRRDERVALEPCLEGVVAKLEQALRLVHRHRRLKAGYGQRALADARARTEQHAVRRGIDEDDDTALLGYERDGTPRATRRHVKVEEVGELRPTIDIGRRQLVEDGPWMVLARVASRHEDGGVVCRRRLRRHGAHRG